MSPIWRPAIKEKGALGSGEGETIDQEFLARLLALLVHVTSSHLRRDEQLHPCAQPGQ